MRRDGLLTSAEVSAAAGISRPTLQHWIKSGKISPPELQLVGGKAVRLWTRIQVARLREMKAKSRPGPKGPRRGAGQPKRRAQ